MTIINFGSREQQSAPKSGLAAMIENYSIEVMPRTAAKVEDFRAILPKGTRVISLISTGPRLRTCWPRPRASMLRALM